MGSVALRDRGCALTWWRPCLTSVVQSSDLFPPLKKKKKKWNCRNCDFLPWSVLLPVFCEAVFLSDVTLGRYWGVEPSLWRDPSPADHRRHHHRAGSLPPLWAAGSAHRPPHRTLEPPAGPCASLHLRSQRKTLICEDKTFNTISVEVSFFWSSHTHIGVRYWCTQKEICCANTVNVNQADLCAVSMFFFFFGLNIFHSFQTFPPIMPPLSHIKWLLIRNSAQLDSSPENSIWKLYWHRF